MIKEYRMAELNVVENNENEQEKMIVEGYAIVFETETDLGWCREKIDRNALSEADMRDCVLKYNHNDAFLILARTRNKSLQLTVDDHGLKIYAEIIDTTQGKDVYKMIRAKLLDKMSFAMSVSESKWDYENDVRTITKISKLYDVSVVDTPAYDSTEISARNKSKQEQEYEEQKAKYNEMKFEKQKIKLLLSL